jgi:hypothetical protein
MFSVAARGSAIARFARIAACFDALLGIVLLVLGSRAGAVENAVSSRCLRQAPEAAVVELLELTGVFERARAQTRAMVDQLRRSG